MADKTFTEKVVELRKQGKNEADVAKELDMSIFEIRTRWHLEARRNNAETDLKLIDAITKYEPFTLRGNVSNETITKVAKEFGCSESMVKNRLKRVISDMVD